MYPEQDAFSCMSSYGIILKSILTMSETLGGSLRFALPKSTGAPAKPSRVKILASNNKLISYPRMT